MQIHCHHLSSYQYDFILLSLLIYNKRLRNHEVHDEKVLERNQSTQPTKSKKQ